MTRPRLTPHQRDTLDRLTRRAVHWPEGWVLVTGAFGSAGAVAHLAEKGYVETRTEYGPRGGEVVMARPVA